MAKQNVTKSSKVALREYKQYEEEKNHNKLINAFNRLVNNEPKAVKKSTKLSVTSVAKEAGLSRGTVYLHQDILQKIKAYKVNPSTSDFKRNKSIREATLEKEKSRQTFIKQLQEDKHKLAQENFRLSLELQDANEKISALRKQRTIGKVVQIRT